jgi:hypothetical protein
MARQHRNQDQERAQLSGVVLGPGSKPISSTSWQQEVEAGEFRPACRIVRGRWLTQQHRLFRRAG